MNKSITITSINEVRYNKYAKLKLVGAHQLGEIYHCETKSGKYLWVEARNGVIIMCLADTFYEMGENAEAISKYEGGKPDWDQIRNHMKWKLDEEDTWTD